MRRISDPEGFEEWWAQWRPYRRSSDSRMNACKRYREALLLGFSPEQMFFGAQYQIAKLSDKNSLAYIQLAATYLHQQVFVDDYLDWQAIEERKAQVAVQPAANVIQAPTRFQQRKMLANG